MHISTFRRYIIGIAAVFAGVLLISRASLPDPSSDVNGQKASIWERYLSVSSSFNERRSELKESPSTITNAFEETPVEKIQLAFPVLEGFDTYGTGNLQAVAPAVWAKENAGNADIPVEATKLSITGRETSDFSLDVSGGGSTYDYLPLGGNANVGDLDYDPIVINANTPFYFSVNFVGGTTAGNRARVALRIDDVDASNTGDWIRLQSRRDGTTNNARISLGGSGVNHGQTAVTAGETFQFVAKGVWDGTDEITYEYAINPGPDLASVSWTAASVTQTGYSAPQIGRMFIGLVGTNANARLSDIVISESWTDVVTAAPFIGVKVNFQDDINFPTPADYLADFGEAYGLRTASSQGSNAYTYGWIDINDGTPEDLTNQGRDRGAVTGLSEIQRSIIHMEHPSTPEPGFWEFALPNGDYSVTVEVGDAPAGSGTEIHRINAEGVNIIDNFEPSGAANSQTRFSKATGTVTVSDGKLTLDYLGGGVNTKMTSVEIVPAGQNLPPVVNNQSFSIDEGSANTTVVGTVAATDPDNTLAELSFNITGGNTDNAFAIDNSGVITVANSTALNFCTTSQFVLTVEVSDQEPLTDDAEITIDINRVLTINCSPVSPLACSDVVVTLPVNLDFNSSVANTIEDANCDGTGFTAVLEHSEARRTGAGDLPISFPTLNGYEPSLLDVNGGTLDIASQAGISFLDPPESTNNNNQVNTLGVGFNNLSQVILVKTTILGLNTGGGSAQAGLWFGVDEDNFVKLDVNSNNNVELRVEVAGASVPSQQVQDNGPFSAGSDVILELLIDPKSATNNVEGFYTIGNGNRTSIGPLTLPASYFIGRDINDSGAQDSVSFAGIFATHRNGSQFTASFDEFSVEVPNVAPVLAAIGDQTVEAGQSLTVNISATDADDNDADLVFGNNNLPSFTTFTDNNDGTATLEITPAVNEAGDYPNVEVNVTDGEDSDSETFTITVTPISNVAPTVANAIVDQTATENVPFSFTIPADAFDDANGDDLTYVAVETGEAQLPDWLDFDANTQEFSGTPGNGDVGTLNITVTASDAEPLSVTDEFVIEIAATPSFPWQVNFQDESTTPPAGYFKDFGEAFALKDNGLEFGWLAVANDNPIDLTTPSNGVGRNRGVNGVSLLQNTLVHMQGNDVGGWNGNRATESYWEVTIPNGWYEVSVSVGDPNQDGNVAETPIHHINVEGVTAINEFAVNSNLANGDPGRFQSATVKVNVADGALTVDPVSDNSRNTKINFVTIAETTPPSTETDIVSFSFTEETGTATIDTENHTVDIEVALGTDPSSLIPTITVSDNATIDPVSGVAQDFSSAFTYTVTAEDATTIQDWTVNVSVFEDTEDPQITNCPSDITVNNDAGICGAIVNWPAPQATDNSGSVDLSPDFQPGDEFPVGTTLVTYTATDDAGNSATCSFNVIVNDTEAPQITCPEDILINVPFGTQGSVVTYTAPEGTDNCEGATTELTSAAGTASGQTFPLGTTQVTYEVTDAAGLTTECSFNVQVVESSDAVDPVINNCPTNITVSNDPGNCSAGVNWTAPTATDNSGSADLTSDFEPDDVFPVGTTTVTYTATDAAGNSVDCTFDVTVNDTEDPVITCPEDITINAPFGSGGIEVIYTAPVGTDNCPGVNTALTSGDDTESGDVFPIGETTVSYEVTDAANNTAVCSFTVTVVEDPAPAEPCSPISTLPCSDIEVALPFTLDFNAEVANTLEDTDAEGVGFTMVDPPSVNQFPAAPSNADVPGYEPSLINLNGGQLTITSTKGINFQKPPTSTNNNTQVNALGVGFEVTTGVIEVAVDLDQPDFASSAGNSSQQGGIWFGLNEDNYVKLVVAKINATTSKVQILRENINPNNASAVLVDEFNSANFPTNLANTINLRLEVDPVNQTAKGFYTIANGNEIQLGNNDGNELSVPASFFAGLDHDSDGNTPALTYAGVFTTHRNAAVNASVDFSFDNFSILEQEIIPALSFSQTEFNQSVEAGSSTSFNVTLGVNDGTTPTPDLSVIYNEGNNWLTLPANPVSLGELSIGLDASNLTPGTYTATVTASETDYLDATFNVSLTVSPIGGPLLDILVNFQNAATTPPNGYIEDHGQAYGLRTEADQGNGQYTYGWIVEAEAGNADATPLDLSVGGAQGNGRNRGGYPNLPVEQTTLMHMQYNDVNGTNGTPAAGAWEFAVPSGTYQVFVNLGDPDAVSNANPENYDLSVEGNKIIDDFVPSGATGSATMFTSATTTVEVTDGKVTIDAQGGTNTKIIWVQITQINVDPALVFDETPNSISLEVAGNGTTGTIGNFLSTNDNTDPQDAAINAVDDATGQVPTWLAIAGNSVDNLPFTTGAEVSFEIDATGLDAGTNYTATVTASADGYDDAQITLTLFAYTSQTPQVLSAIPADGTTDVSINTSVSSDGLFLPNPDDLGVFGINNATITTSTVKLVKVSDGSIIPSTVNGTGGGDGIRLTPSLNLETNTQYRFEVDGVEDVSGATFAFFSSTFTTGEGGGGPSGNDLDNVSFSNEGVVKAGEKFTTLTIGPDGKLYGLTIGGDIHRFDINVDGTLTNEQVLSGWKNTYGARTAIGLTFDPDATAQNLIAYITHCSSGLNGAPEWDGKLSRLTGPDLATEDLILDRLPRSIRDHLTNSMAFKPGENNVIYFNQGSNSAGGAPDNAWGNRPERMLSGATLRLDLDLLPENQWPLDVETTQDLNVIINIDTNSPTTSDGKYNPYFVNAPLTGYAWGARNAYDLVWHSNGQLYIPTNGTAGGSNAPASVDGMRRPDGTFYNYADSDYPQIPAANSNNTQRDFLFRVNPASPGGYYGHPNPFRGQYVLNRGPIDVNKYPNTVVPDVDYRGFAFDFEFNKSPNGVIEYRSNAENGNLQGAILVCRYSGGSDIIALVPDGVNGDISTFKIGIPGFTGFQDPLDLVEDLTNGNIYVSDYGRSQIVLLKPANQSSPTPIIAVAPDSLIFEQITANGATANQTVSVSNIGNADLNNVSIEITGPDAGDFNLVGSIASIAQSQTQNVQVNFDPSSNGAKFATLTVSSSQQGVDSRSVLLKGLGKTGTGGSNEPSLQAIVDTWLNEGAIDVGDDNPATNVINSSTPNAALLGEEVSAQVFQQVSDAPVTIQVLSVYGPTSTTPIVGFGWYEAGDANTRTEIFNVDNTPTSNGQTLTPEINGQLSFDPLLQPFGIYSSWLFFGPDRLVYSEDQLNTFNNALPHHVRVYKVPGEDNAYLIATEEHVSGNDFQDIVVIARNVQPFVEGSLALNFAPDELNYIVGEDGSESQNSTLTANGPLNPADVQLEANQPWVTLPDPVVLGSPMAFGVDATGLGQGNYTATVTATAPNFADATISINLSVTEEVVYTYQVNFQDESQNTPAGYLRDIGEAYGQRTGADQGNGTLTYGWVVPNTTTPVDATANNRARTGGASILENSIILMDLNLSADWLIDLPNGSYIVNAGVGDPQFTDSDHRLEANGVEVVSLVPAGNDLFAEGSAIVEVTNGTLRLAQGVGGDNTKIAFVRIAPFNIGALPPTVAAEFTGNEQTPTVFAGQVDVELTATDNSGSGLASFGFSLDGTNFQPYTTALNFDQPGSYELTAVAVDNNENTTTEVFNFSIAEPSGALIALENMTKIPGTDIGFPGDLDYTFHNNENGSNSATQWHETNVMRIKNDGTSPLTITEFIISDETEFTLPNGELTTPPAPIAPGDFYDLTIEFIEVTGAKGIRTQTITIVSNADNGQNSIATLRGAYMVNVEGGSEITAQQTVQAFGYLTNLGPLNANDSAYPDPEGVDDGANGDLVLSEFFVQADLNEPVRAIQLAAFKGGGGESFALIQPNNNNTVSDFEDTFGGNWHQSLLPKTTNNSSEITGASANLISTSAGNNQFRIRADGQNTSGSGGTNSETGLPVNLGIRTYKLLDEDGNIIPNTYIVIQDYIGGGCGVGSANCDWNDNVYLFYNIRPVAVPTSVEIADANANVNENFTYDVSDSFDNGYPGNNLSFSATLSNEDPLPSWLAINEQTGIFSGTPPLNAISPIIIEVTATDDNGLTVSESFTLTITGAIENILAVSPDPIDFGQVLDTDTPADIDVDIESLIEEVQLLSFSITNFAIIGADASEFDFDDTNTDTDLDPGENTTLPISFTPGEVGTKTATLQIFTDITSEPFTVNITAEVIDACIQKGFAFDPSELVLNDPNCGQTDGSIQVIAQNATGTVTYSLQGTQVSNNTGLFENLGAGEFIIIAVDEEGCSVNDTNTLAEPVLALIPAVSGDPESCAGNDGTIQVLIPDGNDGYEFTLDDQTNTSGVFSGLAAGQYSITITELGSACTQDIAATVAPGCGPVCDPVPAPLTSTDVGGPAITGETCYDPFTETYEITAGGADIWSTSDEFHFVYEPKDCDAEIIAYVESVEAVNPWTKAGVMFRSSLAAGAQTVMMIVTPAQGINFQYRATNNGSFTYTPADDNVAGTAPYWVRIVRSGNTYTGFVSDDPFEATSINWTEVNSVTIDMGTTVQAGIALTSHDVTEDAVAVFKGFEINCPLSDPVADAGPNQTVEDIDDSGSEDVTLDGSGSFDTDGTIEAYSWSLNDIEISTEISPVVSLPVGENSITLEVTDNEGATDTDVVLITVEGQSSDDPNVPPVANAGGDIAIFDFDNSGDELITLDGSASTDDGTIVSYSWSLNGNEIATGVNPSVTLPVGTSNIILTVTDNDGLTDTDDVVVIIDGQEPCNEVVLRMNAGGSAVNAGGFDWAADNSGGKFYFNPQIDASEIQNANGLEELYLTERSATANLVPFSYSLPIDGNIPDNKLIVNLHFAEIYFVGGGQGGAAGSGQRVFSVDIEGQSFLVDFDINDEVGPLTAVVKTFEVDLVGNTLDLDFTASVNQAKISAIEVFANCGDVQNAPPAADAGPNQTVADVDDSGAEAVTLDGSASSDSDGTIVAYSWSLNNSEIATGVSPTVNLPVGTNTITLTVTDDDGATATDVVVITVEDLPDDDPNLAPIANAGGNQALPDFDGNGTETISLNGTASNDPDGTIVSYSWTLDGNEIANTATAQVVLPVGTNTITLTVTDNEGLTGTDVIDVVISTLPGDDVKIILEAECADAIGSQFVEIDRADASKGKAVQAPGNSIRFLSAAPIDAEFRTTFNVDVPRTDTYVLFARLIGTSGSNDSYWVSVDGGTPIRWNELSASPDFVWVTLFDSDQAKQQVELQLAAGSHTISFIWREPGTILDKICLTTDNTLPTGLGAEGTNCDTPPSNIAPIADAGTNQAVVDQDENNTEQVTLDGSGSSDSDGTIVNYSWTNSSGTEIATGVSPQVTLPLGTNVITLTVTDDDGDSNTDQVTITVSSPAPQNQSPIADAGANQTVTDNDNGGNESVTLDGSGSNDPDGTIVSYVWTLNSQPIPNGNGVNPTVVLPVGVNVITLTVTDNQGATDTDQVTVTVNAGTPPVSGGPFILEAECANVIGSVFDEVTGNEYSKGGAIQAQNIGAFLSAPPVGNQYKVVFQLNVSAEEAGTYYVFARLLAQGGSDDSFWFSANGETPIKWNNMPNSTQMQWVEVYDSDNGETQVATQLVAGLNTIELYYREPNIVLDKLYISADNQAPVGFGAEGTNCDTPPANIPPVADAGLNIEVNDNDDNGFETVTLNGSGSSDLDGTVVNYSWTNAAGTEIATGVSPQVSLPVGTNVITLTVTDDEGATDTDQVTITVNEGTTGGDGQTIKLEAECASSVGSNFSVISDANASNGFAVQAVGNLRFLSNPALDPTLSIRMNFVVQDPGLFDIYVRVIAASASFDSYWVVIDGGTPIRFNEIAASTDYSVVQLFDSNNGKATVSVNLTQGQHTIEFFYREPQVILDFVTLTNEGNVPANVPGVKGENCVNALLRSAVSYDLSVYPNPARDMATLSVGGEESGWFTVKMTDIAGKVIETYNFKKDSGNYDLRMSLKDLPEGVYMISVETDEYREVVRLMHMN